MRRGMGRVLGVVGVLALTAGLAAPARGSIPEDPPPQRIWAARYNGPAKANDRASSVAVSPDGSTVFVTGGSIVGQHDEDYATAAYAAATGAQLWAALYHGSDVNDAASSIAVSPDGSTVFVTGYVRSGFFASPDYGTVAYAAATGAQLWAARYGDGGSDAATSIAVSPDGSTVFVTGQSGAYYATVAYVAATGAQLWAARYEGGLNGARSIAVSPDGSMVFVTGYINSSSRGDFGEPFDELGTADYGTVAYAAATGTQLWAARYNGLANATDVANSVAVTPDGSKVFVTGASAGAGSGGDYATVAYAAATGAQLWFALYNGPANSSDGASSVAVSPDGSAVFVTGQSNSRSDASGGLITTDYATVAYAAAAGAQLWAARYNGGAADGASSVAVSPDASTVFVTGYSFRRCTKVFMGNCRRSDSDDYATVAYAGATGAQLWAARYNGPAKATDRATSVAVSPDGSAVFVTGYSDGGISEFDYATVAYRTSSCANGSDETGPVSGPVHGTVEPLSGPATPYVHGVNCDLIAANGL